MSLQRTIFKFSNLWNTYKPTPIFKHWNSVQISACSSQSLEEKYNIPPRPKRPLSAYFRFVSKIRPELKNLMPNAKLPDIMRETAVRWEKVDPALKKSLEAEYAKEQAVYSKVRLEYDTNLTKEQKLALKEIRAEKRHNKEKKRIRKKTREMSKPKRPTSAFFQFLKTQLDSRGPENFTNFVSIISQKWKALSEEQKKPYLDETKRNLIEYQKNMVEWERKMIRMGNTDIVRKDSLLPPSLRVKPKEKDA